MSSTHSHHHHNLKDAHTDDELFHFINNRASYELYGIGEDSEDSPETEKARETYSQNPSDENLLALLKELCYQLRYKEARRVGEQARDYRLVGGELAERYGIFYIKLRDFEKALHCFKAHNDFAHDDSEFLYRAGLCHYYAEEYEEAAKSFEKALSLLGENEGEDRIAALYWEIFSLLRIGKPIRRTLEDIPSEFGHHRGYGLAARLALGGISLEEAKGLSEGYDPLNQVCFEYGLYRLARANRIEGDPLSYADALLKKERYWGSYSSLAMYLDGERELSLSSASLARYSFKQG